MLRPPQRRRSAGSGRLPSPMSNAMAFLGRDMAVDLGTANTLLYVPGGAVGLERKRMSARPRGNIAAVRPLKDGVIADFDVTERMLRYFIQKVHRRRHLARPRLVVAVPSGIT